MKSYVITSKTASLLAKPNQPRWVQNWQLFTKQE